MEVISQAGNGIILDNRYALLECLAVSGVGKIYRGRDLQQVKEQGQESRILIHVLPAMTPALPLDAMFQQMAEARQRIAAPWILAPATYGQDEGTAYFILESPPKWGLNSLISQADANNPVWQTTLRQLQPLVKQKYLETYTDPALLLSISSQEVYLLATALSPLIQMLQSRPSIRSIVPRKPRRAAVAGSVFALTIFSAVAANAIMKQPTVMVSAPAVSIPAAQPSPKVRLAPIPQTEMSSDRPVAERDAGQRLDGNITLLAEQPRQVEPVTAKPAQKDVAVQETTLTEPKQEPIDTPQPSSVPDSIDGTIQQAYAAMRAGRLGTGDGALHFTRQLRGQSPQHPQVARLGQEIAAAYLRQVRVALQAGRLAEAGDLLPVSRQLIQEFGLGNLEPAQQVLEERVAQLNSY